MKQYEPLQIAKIASLLILSILLFTIIGFILGVVYQSKNDDNSSKIKIEKNPDNININNIIKKELNQVKYQL